MFSNERTDFMKTKLNKILSVVITLCMVISLLPGMSLTAFATTGEWSYPESTPTAPFESGTGEADDPYIITTARQLANMAYLVNNDNESYGDKSYKLGANIDLSGGDWTPIGYYESWENKIPFTGVFDGVGYTISNLSISGEIGIVGLFSYTEYPAVIQNVNLVNADISGINYAGGIVGTLKGYVYNCTVSGSISSATAGGIAGYLSSGGIYNSSNSAEVTASVVSSSSNAGGITGYMYAGYVINCSNKGTVSASVSGEYQYASSYAGGIVGYGRDDSYVQIGNCYNIGTVTAENTALGTDTKCLAGALAGDSPGSITNSYWLLGSASAINGDNKAPYYSDSFENASDTVSYTYDYESTTEEVSLLEALNSYVIDNSLGAESSGVTLGLRAWTEDSADINDGYPVLEPLHTHDGEVFFPWFSTDSLPTESGNYYLANDVTLADSWELINGQTINLCLNDRVISVYDNTYSMDVLSGAELTIYDCGTTVRSYSQEYDWDFWHLDDTLDENETTMLTRGGVITGMTYNGGIKNSGTLTINGGNIVGCGGEGGYYSAVHNNESGTLIINGGSLLGNISFPAVSNFGTATLNDCVIAYNIRGGIGNHGTFTMNGGTIKNHNSDTAILNQGTFIMTGGSVTDNGNGGIFNSGTATINGRVNISGNKYKSEDYNPETGEYDLYTYYDADIENHGTSLTFGESFVNTSGGKIAVSAPAPTGDEVNTVASCTSGKADTYINEFRYVQPFDNTEYYMYTDGDNIVVTLPKSYEIYVSGVQVTSTNASDILSDGGTVSFDESTMTLVLNNADLSSAADNDIIINIIEDIDIKLVGENRISAKGENSYGIYSDYTDGDRDNDIPFDFVVEEGDTTATLYVTATQIPVVSNFEGNITGATLKAEGSKTLSDEISNLKPAYAYSTFLDENDHDYFTVYLSHDNTYPVYIEGEKITEENADDVLGDGTVSYDPKTNTLTLAGAEITAEGIVTDSMGEVPMGIYFSFDDFDGDILPKYNLVIKDGTTNTITIPMSDLTKGQLSMGIHIKGAGLNISGGGTLNINGAEGDVNSTGIFGMAMDMMTGEIYNAGKINVSDVTLNISAGAGFGVWASDLTFDNATVNVVTADRNTAADSSNTLTEYGINGIMALNLFELSSYLPDAGGNITVKDSDIRITIGDITALQEGYSGTPSGIMASKIAFEGDSTYDFTYGTVGASGSYYVDDVYAWASLVDMQSGGVDAEDGTILTSGALILYDAEGEVIITLDVEAQGVDVPISYVKMYACDDNSLAGKHLCYTTESYSYPIEILGKRITMASKGNVLGETLAEGETASVVYDSDTNTLYLNGASLDEYTGNYPIRADGDLNIVVTDNSVVGTIDKGAAGIYSTGNLNIKVLEGKTLNVYSYYRGIYHLVSNVTETSALTIEGGGTVNIGGNQQPGIESYVEVKLLEGNVNIEGNWYQAIKAGKLTLGENFESLYLVSNEYGATTVGMVSIPESFKVSGSASAVSKEEATVAAVFNSETGTFMVGESAAKTLLIKKPDHSHADGTEFTAWTETASLPTKAGNYVLTDDVTMEADWSVKEDVSLCLNGHTIDMGENKIAFSGDALKIYNCSETTGNITGTGEGELIDIVSYDLYLYDNVKVSGKEYGIWTSNGTVYLDGAPIVEGTTASIYIGGFMDSKIDAENYTGESFSIYMSDGVADMFISKGRAVVTNCDNTKAGKFTFANEGYILKASEGSLILAVKPHDHADGTSFDKKWTATGGSVSSGLYFLSGDITATGSIKISAGEEVTLCLNGHTLDMGSYYIENNGTLTICDCQSEQGKITSSGTYTIYNKYFTPKTTGSDLAVLNIEGGIIESTGASSSAVNNDGGTVNVTGGSVTSSGARGIDNNGEAYISGGEVSGKVGIYNNAEKTLEISGTANITGTTTYGIDNKGIFTMTGGTVTSSGNYGIYNDGAASISGGEVEGTSGIYNVGGKTLEISGTAKITGDTGISNRGSLTMTGGTVESTGETGNGIYNTGSSANATVSGGSVTSKYYGIYNSDSGTLEMTGGTVTSSGPGGIYNNASASISGGEITAATGVWNGSAKTLEISGSVKITGTTSYGILNNGKLTMTAGSVTSETNYGIYNLGTADISGGNIKGETGIGNDYYNTVKISGTVKVTGTKSYGISTYGTLTMTGGTVTSSISEGIAIGDGSASISGGEVSGTTGIMNSIGCTLEISAGAKVTGASEYGIDNYGLLYLSGSPAISGYEGYSDINHYYGNGRFISAKNEVGDSEYQGDVLTVSLLGGGYAVGNVIVKNVSDRTYDYFVLVGNDDYKFARVKNENDDNLVVALVDEIAPVLTYKVGDSDTPLGGIAASDEITSFVKLSSSVTLKITAVEETSEAALYTLISAEALSEEDLKDADWEELEAEGTENVPVSITGVTNKSLYLYMKAVDEAGNTSYAGTGRIIFYTDSEADTASAEYRLTTKEDKDLKVKLNGNTINKIMLGDEEITADNYEIDGETVTLKGTYLDTLAKDTYTLTFNYNPLGFEYEGQGEAPLTTSLTLKVEKTKLEKPGEDDSEFVYTGEAKTYVISENDNYIISGNVKTNAGEYVVTVSLKDSAKYEWADESIADLTYDFVIEKATVAEPMISSKTYTGETLTATVGENALYSVKTNEGGINAGEYDVILELTDAENYKWSTTDNAEVTLEFAIATADNSWNEAPSIESWTYGEEAGVPSGEAKFGEVYYVYYDENKAELSEKPENAGSYFMKGFVDQGTPMARAQGVNYTALASDFIPFTIEKADYDMTGISLRDDDFTYDGEAHSLVIAGTLPTGLDGIQVTVGYSGSATNVSDGEVTVTATFETASANYNTPLPISAKVKIIPKDIEGAEITLGSDLTFNGSEQTKEITSVVIDGLDVTYTVSGNKATNVKTDGNYILTVTGTGNFEGEETAEWNILKKAPVVGALPTASVIRKNRLLQESLISGGEMLDINESTLSGTFIWEDGSEIMGAVGTFNKNVIFTPDDTNYASYEFEIPVRVLTNNSTTGEIYYTVSFNSNGGSSVSSLLVLRGDRADMPKEPEKEGFTFEGWYKDKKLTESYDFTSGVKGSLVLYAKWSETDGEDEDSSDKKWNPFTDVTENDWFHDVIKEAYLADLVAGTSEDTFTPYGDITRGMFVTILWRSEGEPIAEMSEFKDVKAGEYYEKAISWASENGIVLGFSDEEYAPDEAITREQMAAILFRYAKFKEFDVSVGEDTNILSYNDAFDITEYAIPAMQWACGEGIIGGRGEGYLAPLENATRAEATAMLKRLLDKIKK